MDSFDSLFDEIRDRLLDARPGLAIFLGISKHYGQVFDYSKENIYNTLTMAKADLQTVEKVLQTFPTDKIKKLETMIHQTK